ncbi:MAG: sugar phosphate isomerase/epimerase [Akkermansiaceae bacterium]|nr:sugar phosphate isomerase/epimerase [Akkermansiaceae bacterium]
MKSAITLSQVTEAKAGPFVFHDPLPESFAKAGALGFDAVELFFPGPHFTAIETVTSMATEHSLEIAAVGTGAGMVQQGLSLTDPDQARRGEALDFVLSMVDFGGQLGAPAILGSMQGRWGGDVSRDQALVWLGEALQSCDERAGRHGVRFIYEPLNRYETNLFNQLAPAAEYLATHGLDNTTLLADLFHMNIEESNLPSAIRAAGSRIGHVHFADSNRHAIGFGHTEIAPVIAALRDINYDRYLSAEIFPAPNPDVAAEQTLKSFKEHTARP